MTRGYVLVMAGAGYIEKMASTIRNLDGVSRADMVAGSFDFIAEERGTVGARGLLDWLPGTVPEPIDVLNLEVSGDSVLGPHLSRPFGGDALGRSRLDLVTSRGKSRSSGCQVPGPGGSNVNSAM